MKKNIIKTLLLISPFLLTFVKGNDVISVDAATLPTTIKLNDNTEEEVRSYYSDLSSLPESERKGENLLKNLKKIIAKDNTFYDYGTGTTGIGAIYMITDRNWDASPASSLNNSYGVFDASTNTIKNYNYKENPYIFHYYVDRTYQENNPIKHKEDGASRVSFDKEHIWAKSHGFGLEGEDVVTGAGTDLHHLVAANPSVNSNAHNAYSYGTVKNNSYDAPYSYLSGNKKGTQKYSHTNDEVDLVFEPQDADKGDIARALIYMVARYNYIGSSDTPSKAEPNLELVNYVVNSPSESSLSETAKYGVISELIRWNKFDAPDKYEIHRNNLIYNNYQNNRNPFIDFPEWVDVIYNEDGSFYNGENYANPLTDKINVGNDYVPPAETFDFDKFFEENKMVIMIVAVVLIIAIIIILLIAVKKGKAKISVTKSGKIKIKATNKKSTSKKKSTKKK